MMIDISGTDIGWDLGDPVKDMNSGRIGNIIGLQLVPDGHGKAAILKVKLDFSNRWFNPNNLTGDLSWEDDE